MVCCGLKRYFDAQRVDEAGRSAVRLQKSVLILFILSLIGFAYALFTLVFGGKLFGLVLVCSFFLYWAILSVGFKGAKRRDTKLITTYFVSKLIFELVLVGLLSLVAAATFGLLAFTNIEVGAAITNNPDYYDNGDDYAFGDDEEYNDEGDDVVEMEEGEDNDEVGDKRHDEAGDDFEEVGNEDDEGMDDDAGDDYEEDGYEEDGYEEDGYEDDGYEEDGYEEDGYKEEDGLDPEAEAKAAQTFLLIIDIVFTGFWTVVGAFMLPHVITSVVSLFLALETKKKLRAAGPGSPFALPVAIVDGSAATAFQKAHPSAPAAPTPTIICAPPPADAARVMHFYPHADAAAAASGYTPMVYVMPSAPAPSSSE